MIDALKEIMILYFNDFLLFIAFVLGCILTSIVFYCLIKIYLKENTKKDKAYKEGLAQAYATSDSNRSNSIIDQQKIIDEHNNNYARLEQRYKELKLDFDELNEEYKKLKEVHKKISA